MVNGRSLTTGLAVFAAVASCLTGCTQNPFRQSPAPVQPGVTQPPGVAAFAPTASVPAAPSFVDADPRRIKRLRVRLPGAAAMPLALPSPVPDLD